LNKPVKVTCPACSKVRIVILSSGKNYNRTCRSCCYKLRKNKQKTIGNKHIMKNGYMRICTEKGYVYEHRFIWETLRGPIPKGYTIHHKDGDRTNNDINNLEMLPKGVHNSHDSSVMWEKVRGGKISIPRPNKRFIPIADIVPAINEGKSVRAVASDHGVTKAVILRILAENNYIVHFNRSTHKTSVTHTE
jgi:hypothetical protein